MIYQVWSVNNEEQREEKVLKICEFWSDKFVGPLLQVTSGLPVFPSPT